MMLRKFNHRPIEVGDKFIDKNDRIHICLYAGKTGSRIKDQDGNWHERSDVQGMEVNDGVGMKVATFVLIGQTVDDDVNIPMVTVEMAHETVEEEVKNIFNPDSTMLPFFLGQLRIEEEDVEKAYFFCTVDYGDDLYGLRFHLKSGSSDDYFFKVYKTDLWRI